MPYWFPKQVIVGFSRLIVSCVISLYFTLFIRVSIVFASDYYQDFNDYSYSSEFDIAANGGTVATNSGSLVMSAGYGNKFPVVHLKEDDFTNVEQIEVRYRYSNFGNFGVGLVFDDIVPPINANYSYDVGGTSIFYSWGDVSGLRIGYGGYIPLPSPGDTSYHTYKIAYNPSGHVYYGYDNGVLRYTISDARRINSIWFGNPERTNTSSGWSTLEIDYIKIDDFSVSSSFPYFSQKDERWKDVEYDTASVWAGESQASIERWGCVISSIAMVLQKYGIDMPDGTKITPSVLNTWLKLQPDGYVGKGLVNWLSISRLVREARTANEAETDLEFVKNTGSPEEELAAGQYPIVNEGGHFVVTTKDDGSVYKINDSNDETRAELPKTTTLSSINTYIPSDTNLGYLFFVSEPTTTITLRDEGGSILPIETFNEYLKDDMGGTLGPASRLDYWPKPAEGDYQLQVTNPSDKTVKTEVYMYDQEGGVSIEELTIPAGMTAQFLLDYNSTPGTNNDLTLDYAPIWEYLRTWRIPKTSRNGIWQAVYARFHDLIDYLDDQAMAEQYASDFSRFVTKQRFIPETEKVKIQNYIGLVSMN
ncbi:MAG: hypothetical protein UX38_C0005G0003 [Microgenomates group bacterium GW2011_GWC1_46_16]|uniref:Peptidase C39-like domain-containing protein n=1 Tax=Candidatus Collierbacteria bacterium RIFOXYA2_FULL_46_10 TaxID=1817726 RepID=A0A1F5F710_9BACT|nr:MAG: hypothetical protein UX32_C0011G0002 [Microgenomates group bacterium GW2011_GWF1_46_12]KKU26500.1 MAG: hypothetical protein UX38_C0005G0003 [Microgenomates group bacterium GW2011_GWC1_46_16]KKU27736.1 MAG: hypothetical protein UX40_C0007G0018 [Microgenomates group bacterium GW2011_GWF2_46_18]KKU45019.1 MAG: hypothetical protein UX63_C0015G0012 [Microgenomates group bacterium GW2011_GWB1_46_7]KKU60132.1 MAG: hypothetical protein UX82_C0019G0010 [Microgenomates group bacterium GW2011_GWE1